MGKGAGGGDRHGKVRARMRIVRLGEFARSGLEKQASRWDMGLPALVHQAVVYYLFDRGSERPGRRVPRFPADRNRGGAATEVSVALDEREWTLVDDEARQQRTDVDSLVEHAALYYLADINSGRFARRLPAGGSATR